MYEGAEVSIYYDPMISKFAVYGKDRDQAIERMRRALMEYQIGGIKTTLGFFREVMDDPEFVAGRLDTGFIAGFNERRKEQNGDPTEQDLAIVAAAIVPALVIAPWLFCWQVKRLIVRSIGVDLQFVPAEPDDFPGLDEQKLEKQTSELESLGFVRMADCRFASEAETHGPVFLRLFQHPEHHVLAELGFRKKVVPK